MAVKKKGKKESVDLAFMELEPLDEGDEDLEELDDEDLEEDADEGDLDEEGRMLAETIFGDGDIETRAQALKDFVRYCKAQSDSGDGGY